jgi:ATP-dependent helicase/nuclease subunit A
MSRRPKPLKPLHDEQSRAADPRAHVAVSASAGTGKTQVLTARVFRLLLGGVAPETILCLTFTKAGAAEMANRIGARLAAWVRMRDPDLRKDLFAIGERADDPATLQRARELFARVLDAPGGLRIQTIHSFAQTLLAAFPAEAGIAPGFAPIEGRAEGELVRRTLAELAAAAEQSGDTGLIADLQALSLRFGERDAEKYLAACARAGEAMADLGSPESIEPALRKVVGLPDGDVEAAIRDQLRDDAFDHGMFDVLLAGNRAWGSGKKATAIVANLERFLAASPEDRAGMLADIGECIVKKDGDLCKVENGQRIGAPDYDDAAERFRDWRAGLLSLRSAAALVALQSAGLRAGKAFAAAYAQAKRAAGVADFNDLIGWARELLETPGMGDWVRFKLDRRTDHLLVDEAQDTNADQWAIIDALVDDFFTGSSEAEKRWRTLFTVGDFKQAIFSFQGTNPREYEAMRERVRKRTELLAETAASDPDILVTEFRDVPISASFRSAPAVLELVDGVIRELGHEALGLPRRPEPHSAFHDTRPGRVEWWPAFEPAVEDEPDEPDEPDADSGEEGWLDERDRLFADHLARQVKQLIREAPVLASTKKPLGPGDILVLVRSRAELASLIVARLFKQRVPVAGIDRLHLHRPLAVKDLLAAIAFAVQPLDDLNLANLLVSPLIGWSQDDLYDHAFERGGSLWAALLDREEEGGPAADALALLRVMLAMTDFTTPARFLEEVLSGRIDGRRKLLGRLGEEALDPIEELLTAAIEFERAEVPSLDRFLAWFAGGEVEIKRDPTAAPDAVRVMTVHGAKGLEAPVVILADATADPAQLGPKNAPLDFPVAGRRVPLVRPRKAERCPPFAALIEDQEQLDLEEHWRLLYVALTRAEERLIVTGVKKRRDAPNCWHRVVEQALIGLGAERGNDGSLVHESGIPPAGAGRAARGPSMSDDLPAWLREPAPDEPVPVRPLAPSALAGDDSAFPPPRPGEIDAARRGTLLHLLFERLPGVAPDRRHAAALAWLEHSAGLADPALREEIAGIACALIGDPAHRDLFAPGSLAEAPIAATLADGRVVAGTVDRLLVEPGRVRLVDFKTGSRVPASAADIPLGHRLQMEAYRDALAVIFPGRTVEAALLYTAGPKMVSLAG